LIEKVYLDKAETRLLNAKFENLSQ